jgi:signal transduction histidine kinase
MTARSSRLQFRRAARSVRFMPSREKSSPKWAVVAYTLACAPLILLLLICLWGAYRDVQAIRTAALHREVDKLRSQAVRRAGRLEVLVEVHEAGDREWEALRNEPWLRACWSALNVQNGEQVYSAVVDESGTIVLHTDAAQVGKQLGREWYEHRIPEAGSDTVRLEGGPLAGEASTFNVTVPLTVAGRWIGDYHEGLDATQFDQQVTVQQRAVLAQWLWVLALAAIVDAAAVWGLMHLARRQRGLLSSMRKGLRQRAREMTQLGSGLAHEIRNPLHALRINVHTLRRAFSGRSPLSEEQLGATVRDSDAAIDYLDGLMHDLLQFADPRAGQKVRLDLSREVQATLNLLTEDFRRDQIEVRTQFTSEPATVAVDPARLRQVILNVLTFAQHRAGKAGVIHVELALRGKRAEIAITDNGPALPDDQRARLFEPFQAPVETGSGLGLALVQAYVEEAGGGVACEPRAPAGNRLSLWLPLVDSAKKGDAA